MKIIVFYHNEKLNRYSGLTVRKAKSLIKFCGTSFMALAATSTSTPAQASVISDIGRATFTGNGPGVVIAQLMILAVIGWLFGYIAKAAGKGDISGLINMATIFSCIGIVAGTAFKAIAEVVKWIT